MSKKEKILSIVGLAITLFSIVSDWLIPKIALNYLYYDRSGNGFINKAMLLPALLSIVTIVLFCMAIRKSLHVKWKILLGFGILLNTFIFLVSIVTSSMVSA